MKNNKFVKALLVASLIVSSASIAQAAEGDTIFKARLLGSFPNKLKLSFNGKTFSTTPKVLTQSEEDTEEITGYYVQELNAVAEKKEPGTGTANSFPNYSKKMTTNGLGVDLSGTYFFTNKFASELSAGFIYSKYDIATLSNNKGRVFIVPLTLTAQYHPMAGTQVSPYVGAGIAYIYNSSNGKNLTILDFAGRKKPFSASFNVDVPKGFAGVLQAGVDITATDGIGFNLDIKKYFMKTKKSTITFYSDERGGKAPFLDPNNNEGLKTANTVNLNKEYSPLVVSVGVSFKL